jgi:hypothetical protein
MENLGLFKGSPELKLTPEQRLALFRANQKNRKHTRVPEGPSPLTPNAPTSTTSSPKKQN